MKKLIIIAITALLCLAANAQIYTHKFVLDKFDDTILSKDQKTLIQKMDSTFIIEEKGSAPVRYTILDFYDSYTKGSKDDIVNLFEDVWGYQKGWFVVLEKDLSTYNKEYLACTQDKDRAVKVLEKYLYIIVHRVITTRFSNQYLTECFWVQKGNDRTVYTME